MDEKENYMNKQGATFTYKYPSAGSSTTSSNKETNL